MYIHNGRGENLAVDYIPAARAAKGNVIFCCTPIVPVTEFRKCYYPFADAGFNVYAIDVAGTGASGGSIQNLSINGICSDFDSVVEYISTQSKAPVFLFGDTGIGGIIAQCYAASTSHIHAFAQFACANYRDGSPLGMSKTILSLAYPLIKLMSRVFPNLKIKSPPPQYSGYHADIDNAFYEEQVQRHTHLFESHIRFIKVLLDILCAADSPIKKSVHMPTLVFKTLHDRYFPASYFDRYYESLTCTKKLIEIDDVHNSYYLSSELFALNVIDWFSKVQ